MVEHSGIYRISILQSGDSPQRYYIGQAKSLRRRRSHHLRFLRRGSHKNWPLQNDFNRCGGEISFSFEILLICQPIREILDLYEQSVVDSYGFGELYNINLQCVGSRLGVPMSAETKMKIGSGNKGKPRTPEHIQAVRDAHIGKPLSAEHKRKIGIASKGKKYPGRVLTPEHKANVGAAARGKKRPPEVVAKWIATRKANGWLTDDGREAMRIANAGRRGSKLTEEHKRNIGASGLGRKASPEALANMSRAQTGRTISEEHRAKLSAAFLGKPRGKKKDGNAKINGEAQRTSG